MTINVRSAGRRLLVGGAAVASNSGYGAGSRAFSVARGYYYTVITYVQDQTDGKTTWVNNRLDASNPNSGYYCVA
jgi:hypothetical protein